MNIKHIYEIGLHANIVKMAQQSIILIFSWKQRHANTGSKPFKSKHTTNDGQFIAILTP